MTAATLLRFPPSDSDDWRDVSMLRLVLLVWVVVSSPAFAQQQVTLRAADGLVVTADVYQTSKAPSAVWIVLAHQAGASRGEYRTIAPRLNKLGYNAIALDQRSGRAFAGVANKTSALAKAQKKGRSYIAARPDIEAGVAWARKQTSGPVILWGSSYSAALALLMSGEKPQLVDGVISHAPGEYFRGKSIRKVAVNIAVPVLITSASHEKKKWRRIFAAIPGDRKTGFAPKKGGRHGSSALIPSRNKSSAAYWTVVETYLKTYFQPN
ncbi:MAG: alpha/beta hydrolase [Pseudomonadota bacterium]